MAELVPLPRGRRGSQARGEVAIAVQGALPARQRDPTHEWANWQGNHSQPAKKTLRERDQDLINRLRDSRRVRAEELCHYITPDGLLGQGEDIDPINDDINDIINNMSRTRRMLLEMKMFFKSKSIEMKEMEHRLKQWPVEVQQLQGLIREIKGARYLRIPDVLVDDLKLID